MRLASVVPDDHASTVATRVVFGPVRRAIDLPFYTGHQRTRAADVLKRSLNWLDSRFAVSDPRTPLDVPALR